MFVTPVQLFTSIGPYTRGFLAGERKSRATHLESDTMSAPRKGLTAASGQCLCFCATAD